MTTNNRFYSIGGITIELKSDLPINDHTYNENISKFEIDHFENIDATLYHHFDTLPVIESREAAAVYYQLPWKIYKTPAHWVYYSITPQFDINSISIFDLNYLVGNIYNINPGSAIFQRGNLPSITLYPTDQILISQLLFRRSGCYIHSSGVIWGSAGILFVGHSGAGKSTIVKILQDQVEVLCDDRIILRDFPDGFRIFGTWSHGEIPNVSPKDARLKGIFFLEKADSNYIMKIEPKEIVKRLPFYIIKPLVTADWWIKTLDLVERIALSVPAYRLGFNKSGKIEETLNEFISN